MAVPLQPCKALQILPRQPSTNIGSNRNAAIPADPYDLFETAAL